MVSTEQQVLLAHKALKVRKAPPGLAAMYI